MATAITMSTSMNTGRRMLHRNLQARQGEHFGAGEVVQHPRLAQWNVLLCRASNYDDALE
jgi:hypothetical protein